MKSIYLSVLLVVPLLAQPDPVQRAVDRYNEVTANCPNDSCRVDAQEAARELLQRLVAVPPNGIAKLLVPEQPLLVDPGEGRRIALRLAPERQVGASPSTGSGTSLTNLASITELVSAAMESGAFQRNTAGTVSTIRVNVAGAARFLSGDCPPGSQSNFPLCIKEDRSAWRGLSVMASFDSSRNDQVTPGNAANPAASAGAVLLRTQRGLASAGVRYDFFKPANQQTQTFRDQWKTGVKELKDKATAYSEAYAAGPAKIIVKGLAEGLPAKLHQRLLTVAPQNRRAVAEEFFADFVTKEKLTMARSEFDNFQKARRALLVSQVDLFRDTLDRRLFSLEFQHQRPKDQPAYGNFTFIWTGTAGKHIEKEGEAQGAEMPNWQFTANAAANFFYDQQKVQKDRVLRDIQLSFQADRKLWNWKVLNQPAFSFAAYFQRLTDDTVLSFNSDAIVPNTGIVLPKPANVILKDTKGNVGIVQAKLTIQLKDSGVSVPLAVTWSNRTELLRLPGNDVRGHFGLQFDMDKLLEGLKPKQK